MTDPPRDGDGLDVSRRDALRGMGAVGGASLFGTGASTALGQEYGTDSPTLDTEMVREYWSDTFEPFEGEHSGTNVPVTSVRGLSQTNLIAVDDEHAWRNPCGGTPSIEHQFTLVGYFFGVEEASVEVSVPDELVDECGRSALTTNYAYQSRTGREPSRPGSFPDDRQELRTEFEDRYAQLDDDRPRRFESFLEGTEVVTGAMTVATMSANPVVMVGAGALAVASFLATLSDATPEFDRELGPGALSLSSSGGEGRVATFFLDFSVVVPAGESSEFEVVQRVEQTGDNHPTFDDLTFDVDIPAIEHDEDLSSATTPTIALDDAPITYDQQSDGSLDVDLNAPSGIDVEDPVWNYGGSGSSSNTGPLVPGGHELSWEALEPVTYQDFPAGYRAVRPGVVEDSRGNVAGELEIVGSPAKKPGIPVSYAVDLGGLSGSIDSYEWRFVPLADAPDPEPLRTDSGSGDPSTLWLTYDETGAYRVEIEVETDAGRRVVLRKGLQIIEEYLPTTIDGPRVVPTGTTVSFSIRNSFVDPDLVAWSGAGVDQDATLNQEEVSLSFGSVGSKRLEVEERVQDVGPNGEPADGYDSHAFQVVDESPVDVEMSGPDSVSLEERDLNEPVDLRTSVVEGSPNGPITTFEWTVYGTEPGEGEVPLQGLSRTGTRSPTDRYEQPSQYELQLDGTHGWYRIECRATDAYGVGAVAEHELTVERESVDVTILGPVTVPIGQEVEFGFEVEDADADVEYETIQWTGDVTGVDVESPTETFSELGTKTAELYLQTSDGGEGSATFEFEVVEDTPIEVDVGGPDSAQLGATATLDATAEANPNGVIERYEWRAYAEEPGEGYVPLREQWAEKPTTAAPSVEQPPTTPAEFELALDDGHDHFRVECEIVDEFGVTGVGEHDVAAERTPVDVTIDGPKAVPTGQEVEFRFEVADAAADVGYESIQWTGDVTGVEVEAPTETFSGPGTKTAELYVQTTDGGEGSATLEFEVVEDSPIGVDVGGPDSAQLGATVTLDATAETNPNGVIERYEWRVYAEQPGEGYVPLREQWAEKPTTAAPSVEQPPTTPAEFELELLTQYDHFRVECEIVDEFGVAGVGEHAVAGEREPIDVTIDGPKAAPTGQEIEFGFGVADDDVGYESIQWTGDVTGVEVEAPTETFSEPGTKTAELYVQTVDGREGSDTLEIAVTEESPIDVSIDGPGSVEPGTTVDLDGAASVPAGNGDLVSHEWRLYYEEPYEGLVPASRDRWRSGGGSIRSYSFTVDRSYFEVRLDVTDEYGVTGRAEHAVERELTDPSVSISGPSEADELGEHVTVHGSADDLNGSAASHQWDVYESVPHEGLVRSQSKSASGDGPPGSHTFELDERHSEVELTVTDEFGRFGTASRHDVDVPYDGPTAVIDGPTSGSTDEQLSYDASASEGVGNEYEWDVWWNSPRPGVPGETVASGTGLSFSFSAYKTGTFDVTLAATDVHGNEHETTLELEVDA